MRTVGAGDSLPHDSAHKHVTGAAIYTDDERALDGELHLAPVLADIARGTIQAIDTTTARAVEGVVGVWTAADVPGRNDTAPVFDADPLMADERVSFFGQVVAVVAAEDLDTARRAARLVEVDATAEDPSLDLATAFERGDHLRPPHRQERGDPDAALSSAAHRLSGELVMGGQEHFYLEGQVARAVPGEDGDLWLSSSTQNPTEMQHLVARILDRDMKSITVEVRRMGGGFGGKETQSAQAACLAALVADATGRPARMRLRRHDDMVTTGKRHDFLGRWEVGFDDDGRITALVTDLVGNAGHSVDLSEGVVDRAMFHVDNCYFLPAARVSGHTVATNTVSNTAFRGFGGPQGMLVGESVIEAIARHRGLDPLEVRRRNFYAPVDRGDGRDTTHYGQQVTDNIIAGLVEEVATSADYDARRDEIAASNAQSTVLRRGIALTPVKFGIAFTVRHLNQAGALVHVYKDGSIHLNHGGTEMGQGLFVKVAQVVASELGVDVARVRVSSARTDKVPNTSPTAASAGTDLNGMAAQFAAREIRGAITTWLADRDDVDPDDVVFADDQVTVGERTLPFATVAHEAYMARVPLSSTGHYATPDIHYDRETGSGHPFFYYAYGAAVSEVVVDTLTGEMKVVAADLLHDVGRSINPAIDLGQVEGGFVQGVGWLTTEQLHWADDGRPTVTGPSTYKIPAIGDPPEHFEVRLVPDSVNLADVVYRSKAVGEPPLMLAISVWCAIKDAIASLADGAVDPPLAAPATPEAILAACDAVRADGVN
ncbi:xanthine dehydrogenase molybdopterin binding subunit [Nitriliruptoria bacterium AS10]|nr:xanthine dehydrogenase molybdopterin binding subunit [Salsipaludibacter albus]